ncbi:MAG: outer membrane protein assembly factor BamD [Bacteroidetes bacterium]|nr:outer membrane protein assembly factor BamD [Bacteroidota bacterium]MBX7044647.1 outer membrane protein assembly factor BamD [Ignavibacteria bacterium]
MKLGKSSHSYIKSVCIVFALCFSALIFSSCGSSKKGDRDINDDPEKAYETAYNKYKKGDYYDAIEDFGLIKLKYSGTKIIDKAIFYLGMSYYGRKEYVLAAYEFEYLLKNYPGSDLSLKTRYQLAMCYYGLSPSYNLDQTYTKYAIQEFRNFIDLYPKDQLSIEAEKRIVELKNKLALKELKAAEQYMILGNYKSAIIYYDALLDEFFETDLADDALYGKIQALMAKKKYDDVKKEIERFESKFRNSSLMPNIEKIKNRLPK